MYGSTVGYGGGFTMGDGTYTMPPLVLSAPKSYQGNSALTGLTLSMGIQQHLAAYLGYKQEPYVYRGPENGQGGGLYMMSGDMFGLTDLLGLAFSSMEPENRESAIGLAAVAIILTKGRAAPAILRTELAIEQAEAKIIIGNGGNYVSSMNIIREVQKGEKISDLVSLLQNRTLSTGVEHAVVTLGQKSVAPGARVIVSGGPHGISFGAGEVKTIFGHTHPFVTGPSAGDFEALKILNQSRQYIIEGFNSPFMIRKP